MKRFAVLLGFAVIVLFTFEQLAWASAKAESCTLATDNAVSAATDVRCTSTEKEGYSTVGTSQVAAPTDIPIKVAQATPAATDTPPPTAVPTAAITVAPTLPAAPGATPATDSSIPVVVVLGIVEAAVIIGVLVFLFRQPT